MKRIAGLVERQVFKVPINISLKWLGVALVIGVIALLLRLILPPAYDFHGVYYPAIRDLESRHFSYITSPGYLNPPWALILLAPLGWMDVDLAHAVLVAVTFVVTYWAMSDYRQRRFSFPLAVIAMPMLAVIWLGQLEVFALAGALLGYRAVQRHRAWWLAVALLLLLIKPQETWIIIGWLVFASARQWSKIDWLKIILPIVLIAGVTSWWLGIGWITRMLGAPVEYAQQWQNFALWQFGSDLSRVLSVVLWLAAAGVTLWGLRRTGLDRVGLGLAAVGSNLLSPYLTNPQLLITLCLGWGVLFDRSRRWGVVAYIASLTPLLRLTTGNQAWNQLDVIFLLLVWLGLSVDLWRGRLQLSHARLDPE